MWQSYTVAIILIVCLFFIGRRLRQQFKDSIDPAKEKLGCSCGCSGCSSQAHLPQNCKPARTQEKKSTDR